MLDEFVYCNSIDAKWVPDLILGPRKVNEQPITYQVSLCWWPQLSVIALLQIVVVDFVGSLMDTLGAAVID